MAIDTLFVFENAFSDGNSRKINEALQTHLHTDGFGVAVLEEGCVYFDDLSNLVGLKDRFNDTTAFYMEAAKYCEDRNIKLIRVVDPCENIIYDLLTDFAAHSKLGEYLFLDGTEISFDFCCQNLSHAFMSQVKDNPVKLIGPKLLNGGKRYQSSGYRFFIRNRYRKYYLSRLSRYDPWSLNLDITRRCNLRCIKCLFHSPNIKDVTYPAWSSKPLDLPLDLAYRVIDVLPDSTSLSLGNSGEPLTYPHFKELITYIGRRTRSFSIYTNITRMSPQVLDFCVGNGLSSLVCSLDSLNEQTHARMVPGNYFRIIMKNLEYILSKEIDLTMVFVRVPGINDKEFPSYLRKFIDQTVQVIVNEYRDINRHVILEPNRSELNQRLSCLEPFISLSVSTDGLIGPACCIGFYDHLETLKFGDIRNESLMEVWEGQALANLRDVLLEQDLNAMPLACRSCTNAENQCKDRFVEGNIIKDVTQQASYYTRMN